MTQAANLAALGTNANSTGILPIAGGGTAGTGGAIGFKNRIINGAMVIDQRNAGASVTATDGAYTLDRWKVGATQSSKFTVRQNAGSVTPPAGFTNYLGITSSSAYSVVSTDIFWIGQLVEGFNVADLDWGTANAKTVTLSFWVRSSLTGTFGGSITNLSINRSYPFSYTISSANTWQQIAVTIAGDTSGSWNTTNSVGMYLTFGLGTGSTYSGTANTWAGQYYGQPTGSTSVVGTNGATFYITGVQLEVGTAATNFDVRAYGTELMLCQRYFESSYNPGVAVGANSNIGGPYFSTTSDQSGNAVICVPYRVTKRTVPTQTFYTDSGTAGSWDFGRSGANGSCGITSFRNSQSYCLGYGNVGVNWSACYIYGHWTSSAEL